jgi:hypothetical protein
MAGFDFAAGRSNNMVEAELRGMVTIGRWGKRFGVSAAAVEAVMRPSEAHHTGTGRRGKSRLTPVIDSTLEPTAEQLAAMQAFDHGQRPQVAGVHLKWGKVYDGPYGRKRFVPLVAVFEGDEAASRKLKEFTPLAGADLEIARQWEGKDLREFRAALAEISWQK